MLFLSDIVRKEGSIVAKNTDNCLLCRIMEKVKVSVPWDFSALAAEGGGDCRMVLGVRELWGFVRRHVGSEPGGNRGLWRAPCSHTVTGAGPVPAELAMNWNSGALELNCLRAVCFVCLWTVLVSCFQLWACRVGNAFSSGTTPFRLHVS